METKPDTIKVSAIHRQEVEATHADLFVTVRGASAVSGSEAMKKAKEVSQLVDELARFGIPEADVHLQGVHVETSSGGLLRSSSASYRLRIRCAKLEQFAGMLDIITGQKNAIFERVEWKYPEDAGQSAALETAIAKAKAKASKVAAALGVRLLGVYDFMENTFDQESPAPFAPQAAMMKARSAAPVEPSLGMDIQHSKTIQVSVDVWYRVSGLDDD